MRLGSAVTVKFALEKDLCISGIATLEDYVEKKHNADDD
jgi:hypothetical protein